MDRLYNLKMGSVIEKTPCGSMNVFQALMPFADDKYLRHLNKLCTDGLSNHGKIYLSNPWDMKSVATLLELYFEYIRHIHYRNRPSRFQSLFAFDSLERAERFKLQYAKSSDIPYNRAGLICEIEYHGLCFMADMNHLRTDLNPEIQKQYAFAYWKGEPYSTDEHYSPDTEYLLELPVKISRIID